MSRGCYRIEELGEIADLDPQDPRAAHLKACAHCRARLAACREFRDPTQLPEGADLEDAERRLAAVLEGEIRAKEPMRGTSRRTSGAGQPRPAGENPLARFLGGLWRPSLKPTLGILAASLAAVLVIVSLVDFGGGGPDRIVPRGEGRLAQAELSLHSPRPLAGGGIRLSWQAAHSAEAYRILLYDADLNELSRLEAGRDTFLIVQPAEIRQVAGAESQILWQVSALHSGDEIIRSPLGGLRLP